MTAVTMSLTQLKVYGRYAWYGQKAQFAIWII